MKLFKTTVYAFAAAVAMCTVSACGGDDDDKGIVNPDPIPSPDPVEGVLSAEDAKEYVEDTASDFLDLFNANDQKQVVDLADYVAETYGDLEIPEAWGGVEDYALNPASFTSALVQAVRTHSFNPLSRAAYTYEYSFSDFTGVYEPGRYAWEKTSDSNDLIFRFRGPKGNCELKVTASGKSCTIEDYDDYYDEAIRVNIPKNVNVTLTEGSTTHVNLSVVNELNINGHSYNVSVKGTVANLGIEVESRGSDSQLTESQKLSIDGKVYQTSVATVNGRNMLDENTLDRLDEDNAGSVFQNGTAAVNIMGNIEVKGQVKSLSNILKVADDTYFDKWGDYSKDEAISRCRTACNTINSNITADVYFGGNSAVQASLIFQPELEDDYYWYVEAVPAIKYAADGSTQTFDEALDSFNFGSLERQWESLVNSYRRLFR